MLGLIRSQGLGFPVRRCNGFGCKAIACSVPCINTAVSSQDGEGAHARLNFSMWNSQEAAISTVGSHHDLSHQERRIWDFVSDSPLKSLWNLQGVPVRVVARRAWKSIVEDRIFGHAAELGFYFLFALFPTLFSASSILGLIARSAARIYDQLL